MSEDFMSILGFWILLYMATFLTGYQRANGFTKFLSFAISVFIISAAFYLIVLLVKVDWIIFWPKTSREIVNHIIFLYLFYSSSYNTGYILGK